MTDAEKFEKVVRGLECCIVRDPDAKSNCVECPYNHEGIITNAPCANGLMADALALLKEQEARVMTREELKQIKPWSVYWGEGLYVRNLWPMAFTAEAIMNIDGEYLRDSYGREYELDLYNKDVMGWRIWTARPTKDQRKAVKWDEWDE